MVFTKNANATNNINLIRYFFAKIRINYNLNGYRKKNHIVDLCLIEKVSNFFRNYLVSLLYEKR